FPPPMTPSRVATTVLLCDGSCRCRATRCPLPGAPVAQRPVGALKLGLAGGGAGRDHEVVARLVPRGRPRPGKRPMQDRSLTRRCLLSLVRLAFCTGIGAAAGAIYWCLWLASEGKTLEQAVSGQVEDGLTTLQALACLGGGVGVVVGLLYALYRFTRSG